MDSAQPLKTTRRQLLAAGAGLCVVACGDQQSKESIQDVSQIDSWPVAKTAQPSTTAELIQQVKSWSGPLCIGGGRYSMGGQIAQAQALHLDLRGMNRLIHLDPAKKIVRAQAGMRWRDLLDLLDPHQLSVEIMQSFANFTLGGSESVNCHGRYVGKGAIVHSIRALSVVLADGRMLEASRTENPSLFAATVGGYAATGVVTEVELDLAENTPMQRAMEFLAIAEYPAWFQQHVLADAKVLMHNADLAPPDFDQPLAISWRRTKQTPSTPDRLRSRQSIYAHEQNAIWAASELPGGNALRERRQLAESRKPAPIVWRNYEASLDVASLEPRTRSMSTYVLQEYFIPVARFLPFVAGMQRVVRQSQANVLNISIRHAPADRISALPWAKAEVFCFVLYIKHRNTFAADAQTALWTRELIALALSLGGRYYLPYRRHASVEQFRRAYPEHAQFAAIKAEFDPNNRFRNHLWDDYLAVRTPT